jgi:MFS family permease
MTTRVFGIRIDRQSRRRALVVTLYLSYVALIACFALAGKSGIALLFTAGLLPAGLVLVGTFVAISQLALPYATEGTGAELRTVDERQIQVRDRAFYRGYQVLSALFGLWIVYETIARTSRLDWLWVPSTFDEYQAIVWGYLLISMTLPSAIIAWTEPDLEESESDVVEVRLAR